MSDLREMTSSPRHRLILPALAPFYHRVAQPLGWLCFRLVIGGLIFAVGWEKIQDPFGMQGFLENVLGLPAGDVISMILALVHFLGGALIIIGLWTRPAALANAIVLFVTLWFHLSHPYGEALLTAEGMSMLKSNAHYLTVEGQRYLLADAGYGFLAQVQQKAVLTSLLWTLACALLAAFGAGAYSLDRSFRREF